MSAGRCGGPALMLWISTPILLHSDRASPLSPKPPLIFDASTHSMEPKSSAASYALAHHHGRNAVALGTGPSASSARRNEQQLHDYWQKVAAHWNELQEAGKIKSFSTPAALALSPQRIANNRAETAARLISPRRVRRWKPQSPGRLQRETFASAFDLARSTCALR